MEDLDKTFLKRIAEVGLLAATHADSTKQAGFIFDALQKVRPQQAATLIGCATMAMNCGRFDEAIRYLSSAQPSGEDADKVKIFLALAYQGAGREQERNHTLNEVVSHGSAEAKKLAEELIGQQAVKA